ncbi:hypothetical protein C8R44DRAFT_785287 [Mycena epipterygia]|nr:hypothetical protein C8R44DRAFT_785287 [Mycena epipterygia]
MTTTHISSRSTYHPEPSRSRTATDMDCPTSKPTPTGARLTSSPTATDSSSIPQAEISVDLLAGVPNMIFSDTNFAMQVSLFHQIHCLQKIRDAIVQGDPKHDTRHCLNLLRQTAVRQRHDPRPPEFGARYGRARDPSRLSGVAEGV